MRPVKTIDRFGSMYAVEVSDGFAYLATREFQIIDIDPIKDAEVIKKIETGHTYNLEICGDYAYLADWIKGLIIVDITTPQDAYIKKEAELASGALGVDISGNYAYVSNTTEGLQVIDISNIETVHIVGSAGIAGGLNVACVVDGYAYATASKNYFRSVDWNYTLLVIDIDPLESAEIVYRDTLSGSIKEACVLGNLAVFLTSRNKLELWNIEKPEKPQLVKVIEMADTSKHSFEHHRSTDVCVEDGYAYIPTRHAGLQVISINPPEDAEIVHSVPMPPNMDGDAGDISVWNGHAFITLGKSGVQIIDISNPEKAHTVGVYSMPFDNKEKMTGDVSTLAISNGYAYVAECFRSKEDSYTLLHIIDIDPLENINIVNTVTVPDIIYYIYFSGNEARLLSAEKLFLLNPYPPEKAHITKIYNPDCG